MKNNKNTIGLIFAAVSFLLCGMLPVTAGKLEDGFADKSSCYKEIKTVQFFRKLNDTQKLYLLSHGTVAEIAKERANLKQENMFETVRESLLPFTKTGYMEKISRDFSLECEPMLYYSNKESNLMAIFWEIQMEKESGGKILLYLDDATGKILTISYDGEDSVYDQELFFTAGELFWAYLSYMDWFDDMEWYTLDGHYYEVNENAGKEYEENETVAEENVAEVKEKATDEQNLESFYKIRQDFIDYGYKIEEGEQERIWRWGDSVYGEMGIRLSVSETGFQIEVI